MSWTKGEVTLLIEEYRKWPNLYKIKSANYKNRNLRRKALAAVLEALKNIKPDVTIPEIQVKFQSLKQTATKEKKKLTESQRSGAGLDDIVAPSLWYYNIISFIFDDAEPRSAIDSLDDEGESIQNPESEQEDTQEQLSIVIEEQDNMEDDISDIWSPELQSGESNRDTPIRRTIDPLSFSPETPRPKGKRKIQEISSPVMDQVSSTLSSISRKLREPVMEITKNVEPIKKNASQIFGEFVATKLEQMNVPDIRDQAEIDVMNVLNTALRQCRERN